MRPTHDSARSVHAWFWTGVGITRSNGLNRADEDLIMSPHSTPDDLTRAAPSVQSIALRFMGWATMVLMADLISKHWAVTWLADRTIPLGEWFSLFLVFNTGAAGGISLGPSTWLINLIGTAATVAMVVAVVLPLAKVDARASAAMGMIAGGALGNLASLLGEARGVPDFLAMRVPDAYVVFNLADLGLWAGAMVLMPVMLGLVRLVRAERRGVVTAPLQNPM
jgi:signal peptidase II